METIEERLGMKIKDGEPVIIISDWNLVKGFDEMSDNCKSQKAEADGTYGEYTRYFCGKLWGRHYCAFEVCPRVTADHLLTEEEIRKRAYNSAIETIKSSEKKVEQFKAEISRIEAEAQEISQLNELIPEMKIDYQLSGRVKELAEKIRNG